MNAYRFGEFELSPDRRQLLASGRPVALGQRAFDVLQALIDRRERLVPKSELMDVVWPGLVVEENNLQVQISTLRKVLGPQAIATIPGRGYRFTAPVQGRSASTGTGANGVPGAAATAGAGAPPATPAAPSAAAAASTLYGRDDDLRALLALVGSNRLVTIVGAGGIGKSRLAQAGLASGSSLAAAGPVEPPAPDAPAGHGAPAVWIELAGLADPALLPRVIAQALSVPLAGRAPAQDELAQAVATRGVRLVLDNCEHLLDAVAEVASALLAAAPGVSIVATSQEPLRLPGEQQLRLAPLAVPAHATDAGARDCGAVALFEARVRAADPRFSLTPDLLPIAVDICRRLDGLPLAIELAAARVATLGLRAVRDRLDERFRLLTGGSRAVLRRHQTLRAALEWSHHLLNDVERAVFRRLGVFAGGFTVERAQALAAADTLDEWTVLDALSALVDKSLVVADPGEPPRYRLLETTRAYALEQLADGETAAMLARHARVMLDTLVPIDLANLDCELDSARYAALLLPELDNLRAAFQWASSDDGDPKMAVALAAHVGSLIDYAPECATWLVPVPPAIERADVPVPLAARYWRALAASNMIGHVPTAQQVAAAQRASELYRGLGQPRREFSSLVQLCRHLNEAERHDEARAALDAARALLGPDWPAEFRIRLRRRDGFFARVAGRLDEALAIAREVLDLSRATGDWRLELIAHNNVVDAQWESGPIAAAADEARALLGPLRERPGADSDMNILYANIFAILSEADAVDEALAVARIALPIMVRTRNWYLADWPHLLWRLGRHDAAALVLGAADAYERRVGAPWEVNERRLVAAARAGLERKLGREALARRLDEGARMHPDQVSATIKAAIE